MKIIALFLLSTSFINYISAQSHNEFYAEGMYNFNSKNYSYALRSFQNLQNLGEVEEKLLSSSKFYMGECMLGLEQNDGAIKIFEEFVSQYPTSNLRPLALYRLGNIYFEKELYDNCRSNLVELINTYPNIEYNGSAYHLIGQSFIEEDNLSKAEHFFSSAVESQRNNAFVDQSIFALANLYEKKGDYKEAVDYYDKLLGYHKNSDLAAHAQLRIGVCYYHLKEYDSAVLELSDPLIEELDIHQQNEADYILANTFYNLGEYDNSTDAYRRILKNSPSSQMLDRIRYGLAWIHFQQKNFNDAFKMFRILTNSKEDSIAVKSLYWSAESKRYGGNYGEAIEIHKEFVEKYPDHPYSEKVRLNIGISKYSQKSYTESEDELLESINSSDPITKAKSLTLLGELYLRKNKFGESAELFKRGLQIPNIPLILRDRCYLGLGVSHYFLKNHVESLKNLSSIDLGKTEVDKDKLLFYKGEVNFYLGDYLESLRNYNQVNSDDPVVKKNTIYGKAYSYFNQKEFLKSAYFFNDYLRKYSEDEKSDECRLRLADSYYGSKSFAKASTNYEIVLSTSQKFANDDRSFFNYAQSLFKQGRATRAVNVLNDLQTRFPASKYADESQYLIGWINFQNSRFEDAIDSYSRLFTNYPNSILLPIAYYSIGDSYFNLGNYPKAIQSYTKLITEYSNSPYVYDAVNGIQYCYIVQEKQSEAIEYLNRFIAENKNSPFLDKVQFKKGEIYYSSAEYTKAISEYITLVDVYPESKLVPTSLYWIGKSSMMINKFEEAKGYFEDVLDYSKNNEIGFSALLELGKIYRGQEEFDKEIELYDENLPEITSPKKVSEIKYVKAENYILQNDLNSAYQILNEIVNLRDGSLFYHKAEIELAMLEMARSNYESALFLLNDVKNNREDDIAAQAQYYIGMNYFQQEKLPEAITELKKLVSIYSAYGEWYTKGLMLLGDSYVKINDTASAIEMYRSILKKHKNDKIAVEAKDKLSRL